MDSLLSQVNGGSSDGAGAAGGAGGGDPAIMVDSPPGNDMSGSGYAGSSPYQKHCLLTSKYSSASTRSYKAGSPAMSSNKYYIPGGLGINSQGKFGLCF